MRNLSSDVQGRYTPTSGLAPRKPSSAQYQYAKDNDKLSRTGRTLLSAALEDIVARRRQGPDGFTPDQALKMWLSVQHARLRTHSPLQRFYYQTEKVELAIWGLAIFPLPLTVKRMRALHKKYYRARERPEYGAAFKGFMEMLRAPGISETHKLEIAETLLDQHIRKEGTIAPGDHNRIVGALPLAQRTSPTGRQTVAKAPAKTADDTALHRAIIDFANGIERELAKPETAIAQLARETGWTAAGSVGGKIAHRLDKRSGKRTDSDKMNDFVAHIMQDKSDVTADPFDETLQQYSTTINNHKVILTVGVDGDDNVDCAHAFQHALAKAPVLKRVLFDLKEKGWTIQYGDQTDFNAGSQKVSINPTDPETAILTLGRCIYKSAGPESTQAMERMANEMHKYFLEHEPSRAYKVFYNRWHREYECDDGVYNRVKRWIEVETGSGELIDPPIPGITINDAMAIALYRTMFIPINAIEGRVRGRHGENQDCRVG
jgi:hypothetical protein